MPIGLEDRLINNASGFSIAGAIDNDIRGIYWVANTGARDILGDASTSNSDLRAQYVICIVGSTPYIYTNASIADPDWTNAANWQEFALGDLSQVSTDLATETAARIAGDNTLTTAVNANTALISSNDTDIATNATDIATNASGISTNAAAISVLVSADGSIDTHSDVDTSTVAPAANQVLTWNGINWVPVTPSSNVTVEVKNATALDFDKGQPVYVSGTHASGKPTVELADNNASGAMPAIGLLQDDLVAGAEGLVVLSGTLFNIDTSGYSAGDALYVDSVPGNLVNARPSGVSSLVQKVALVKRSHQSAGSLIIMGAGRTNDVPNIANGNFWLGNASDVATSTSFDTAVGGTPAVTANTSGVSTNAAAISSNAANISTNATGVATNASNISSNLSAIQSNDTDIATNASGIATNATAITGKVTKSGDTMTGFLQLHADPTASLHAATKEYVDTIAAAGLHYHDPVRVEEPGPLTATYDNGTAGVGATLTNAGTQAALVLDGVTLSLNDRVLIYEQANAYENGIYTVTDVGSASSNWVLTRATDTDSYSPSDPNSLGQGDAFFVKEGNTGAGELYVMNTQGSITFGSTGITFTQVAATAVFTAGAGLDLTGTTFSIDNTVQLKPSEGAFADGDKTKLDGISANATANDTDANLLNRANHTGTQLANTISNFDATVTSNAAVTANTAKVSADGLVTTHSDVTDAGSGQIITAAERTTLGNAVQPGDNVSDLNNDASYITAPQAPVQTVNTQSGSVVLDADDIDDTGTTHKFTSAADITKLAGIDTGATANSSDATLLNRANHTGTQTAATISNFDTEVANNAAVTANTAKVSADGLVTTHSDVTDAGSGAIITDAERTKLNGIAPGAEVNVNADWNASGTDAEILNKPVLFDGSYNSLTNVPATFTPSSHSHVAADITNFNSAVTSRINDANLGSLNDVNISSISSGEILEWDGSEWVNATLGQAGIQSYDANLTAFVNTFTLPTTDGSNGQVLQTDGSGAISFATASGGVSSIEGLDGNVTLTAGTGISISDNGSDAITISSTSVGGTTTTVHYARMSMSSAVLNGGASQQNFTSATDIDVQFDTEDDVNGTDITTNTATYSMTVSTAGYYRLTCNMSFYSTAARITPGIRFNVNGNNIPGESMGYIRAANGQNENTNNLTRVIKLAANDEVQVCIHDESTISGAVYAEEAIFEVEKLEVSIDADFDNITNTPTTLAGYGIIDSLQLGTTSTTALAGDTTTITSSQASAITANTAKTSFPGFGTTAGTALEGDTVIENNHLIGQKLEFETKGSSYSQGWEGTIVKYGTDTIQANRAYVYTSAGWTAVDADDENKTRGLFGIALGTDADVDGLLVRGIYTSNVWAGFSAGDTLYIDLAEGAITNSIDLHTLGDFVRVVGYALGSSTIYIDPSSDYIELS